LSKANALSAATSKDKMTHTKHPRVAA
jgi:hypothetical protein